MFDMVTGEAASSTSRIAADLHVDDGTGTRRDGDSGAGTLCRGADTRDPDDDGVRRPPPPPPAPPPPPMQRPPAAKPVAQSQPAPSTSNLVAPVEAQKRSSPSQGAEYLDEGMLASRGRCPWWNRWGCRGRVA